MLSLPRIRPLSEAQITKIIEATGGHKAHEDWDSRGQGEDNADYRLGSAIIELKLLDEEGLLKPERQVKLAELFLRKQQNRPVVVVDPRILDDDEKREYLKIVQGPIQTAVRKARKQLKQSRYEDQAIDTSIIFVINNGFSTISHEELTDLVVHRVRNDTHDIDGVIVAGSYFHGDQMESFGTWPIDFVPIKEGTDFPEFEDLKAAWGELANRHMTDFVQGKHGPKAAKTVQTDTVFEVSGVTFVKPASPLGSRSNIFRGARPRANTTSYNDLQGIAVTIPTMSQDEYRRIRSALPDEELLISYETWQQHVAEALSIDDPLHPVVPVPITRGSLEGWKRRSPGVHGTACLRFAANELFAKRAKRLSDAAEEMLRDRKPPKRFLVVVTEVIGQDERNDLSHLTVVEHLAGERRINRLIRNARIPFAHAMALAAAHAMKLQIDSIFWTKDLDFAWT